ncbi:MAG: hypothetical protein LUJ25_03090, partial [Firmicutes bacterium]|nr:hypothetical protein [Bacillota bacterium]
EGNSSYELEFRHHSFEDPKISYGRNLVAFDLSSLPDTEENIVELKIKVRTYEGEEIFKVKYNSNGKVNGTPEYVDNVFAESLIHMKNIE